MEPSPCVVNGYMMRSSTSAFRQTRARAVVDALEREMDPWFESLNQRFDIFEARLERKLDDFELRMTGADTAHRPTGLARPSAPERRLRRRLLAGCHRRSNVMSLPRVFGRSLAALLLSLPLAAAAQQLERDVPFLSEDIAGRLDGFSYQEGPESSLEFRGTSIALAAEGDAEIEFQEGRTRVDIEVDKLPDPWSLGPFATYVLWAVTVDGYANNLGSIDVDDAAVAVRFDGERGAALCGDRAQPGDRAAESRQAGARREIQHSRAAAAR
jgi:hypothetical protein